MGNREAGREIAKGDWRQPTVSNVDEIICLPHGPAQDCLPMAPIRVGQRPIVVEPACHRYVTQVAALLILILSSTSTRAGEQPRAGLYTIEQIERVKSHPRAKELLAGRAKFILKTAGKLTADSRTTIAELCRVALYAAEYERLAPATGPNHAHERVRRAAAGLRRSAAARIAANWPGDLSRHRQIYVLLDLARVASLAPDTLDSLAPLFRRALADIKSGALPGTNAGMALWARTWMIDALTQAEGRAPAPEDAGLKSVSALDNYGKCWGLRRYLDTAVDDNGLFLFDGNDLWYWFFNSRPAFVAVGWGLRGELETRLRKRFDAMYLLPIRTLCAGGAHPLLGASYTSPKSYRFFGGWLRDWPGDDESSRWARATIRRGGGTLRFDDLIVPADPIDRKPFGLDTRPPIARGTRTFGGRFTILEANLPGAPVKSLVINHGFQSFDHERGKIMVQINGGHQRANHYPLSQLIDGRTVWLPDSNRTLSLP